MFLWSQFRREEGETPQILFVGEVVKRTAALDPLDFKEPYVRVVPDWRIHVAAAAREEKQALVKMNL